MHNQKTSSQQATPLENMLNWLRQLAAYAREGSLRDMPYLTNGVFASDCDSALDFMLTPPKVDLPPGVVDAIAATFGLQSESAGSQQRLYDFADALKVEILARSRSAGTDTHLLLAEWRSSLQSLCPGGGPEAAEPALAAQSVRARLQACETGVPAADEVGDLDVLALAGQWGDIENDFRRDTGAPTTKVTFSPERLKHFAAQLLAAQKNGRELPPVPATTERVTALAKQAYEAIPATLTTVDLIALTPLQISWVAGKLARDHVQATRLVSPPHAQDISKEAVDAAAEGLDPPEAWGFKAGVEWALERVRPEDAMDALRFVERWVNHHGQKPHITPQEVLSMLQHYPAIKVITKGYADGVVPQTYDPFAEIRGLKALLAQALHTPASAPTALESAEPVADDLSGELVKRGDAGRLPEGVVVMKVLKTCQADRDGDCSHTQCPQLRDKEPGATGRHCPLDNRTDR